MTPVIISDTTPLSFEKRRIKTKDGSESEFSFLIVDRAEKWPEAHSFRTIYDLPILGTPRKIRFELQGVSLAEWEVAEDEHRIPEWDGEGTPTPDFELSKKQITTEKMVHIFEMALGKKVPGVTFQEKAAYIKRLNEGEVQALFYYVQNKVCNLFDTGKLIARYNTLLADRVSDPTEVLQFKDFEEWETATQSPYIFRMQRPCDDYICEFPLKNISMERKLEIEQETRDPEVPKKPKRDPNTKRLIQGEMVPDFQDEGWLKRCRAVSQKRTVLYFSSCLPFEIPGANLHEQYEWIAKRLVGDVIHLKQFIEEELCGYRSRYDFFTNI